MICLEETDMSAKAASIFAGSIFFFIFTLFRDAIPVANMVFYILACAVFAVAALLCYALTQHFHVQWKNTHAGRILALCPASLTIAWMILFYINETNAENPLPKDQLIRKYFPFPVWIVLMLAGTGICLFLLRKNQVKEKEKLRHIVRKVVAVLFAAVTGAQFYAPNIFQDILGGTYHSHAYTNSIINVCWLTPYSEDFESLYGHYAILYMPFVRMLHKLFKIDYLTGIFLICACLAGVSILLFSYVLDYFAEHDVIYYLALLGVGEYYYMLMQGGVYMQVHPHRMIFPMLLSALAVHERKKNKTYPAVAVILLTLSVVWSTEVGMVLLVAFSLYRFITAYNTESGLLKNARKLIPDFLLYTALPGALSYLIVNAYNLMAGGSILDFAEFMYPLVSDRGYITQIELPLPDSTHAWVALSILLLVFVCSGLISLLWKTENVQEPLLFFFAITGLGLMIYYVNRATEGSLFIDLFYLLILQAVILQKTQNFYIAAKDNLPVEIENSQNPEEQGTVHGNLFAKANGPMYAAFRVITVFLLFVMAFDCVYSMPGAIKTASETIWKRSDLQEFADYVWVQVPPDAVSFGEGVPELMSMVDRDTHLHCTEWSYLNMPLDTMGRIREEIDGAQWIFCSLKSLAYLQDNYPGLTDGYEVHEVFEYNGENFGFFVRNESE